MTTHQITSLAGWYQVVETDAGGTATDASPGDASSIDGPAEAQATESGAPEAGSAEAGASDAGAAPEAGAPTCTAGLPPIVPSGGASDPTTTLLWAALRGASGPGLHNMPYSVGAGVTFTQADLDRISAWIQEGAQDN